MTTIHNPSGIMSPPGAAQDAENGEQVAGNGRQDAENGEQDAGNGRQPTTNLHQLPRVAWLASPHKTLESQLYASHLLSTCNSRAFEFAAVLFLASLFPSTLRPLSVYALARGAAAILLAQPVGACIDACDRLAVVRASIVAGRAAVAGS
ncbi:Solute carrier family 40 member 1, partial [Tolypocladium capitatum]